MNGTLRGTSRGSKSGLKPTRKSDVSAAALTRDVTSSKLPNRERPV